MKKKPASPPPPSASSTRSFEIEKGLYLVRQVLAAPTQPLQPAHTHHLCVIDCSGSMSGDLPDLVRQLSNRLPSLVSVDDRVSIIWFSGRGECGVILEYERMAGVQDLTRLQKLLKQWLRPVGMTGFVEPLQLVTTLVNKYGPLRPTPLLPISLFFMSDGCDNQWSRQQVLDAVTKAAVGLAAATFVEYGYYADRALLAAMAARAGGTHIFAKDFGAYEPVFDAAMRRTGLTTQRRIERIEGDPIEGIVFTTDAQRQELTAHELKDGAVALPEDASVIWYLAPTPIGSPSPMAEGLPVDVSLCQLFVHGCYAAASLFATRMKPLILQPLLGTLGDVSFIKEYAGCFGKQRYSLFMARAQRAAFDPAARLTEGRQLNMMPAEDAFTILDLLEALVEDKAKLLLDESFEYDAIGRARASTEGDDALTPVYIPQPDGYPIANLTWNEARANVSVLVRRPSTVDLTERLKGTSDLLAKMPAKFETFVWRNYALIKDGLVNVGKLSVRTSAALYQQLRKRCPQALTNPSVGGPAAPFIKFVIDLTEIPILNRKMIATEIKAKTLAEIERDLAVARAEQKVYNGLVKELGGQEDAAEESPRLAGRYGDEVAAWLAEQGLTDKGFTYAHTKQVAATDVYLTRELDVGVTTAGWKTLKSFADIKEHFAARAAFVMSQKNKAPKALAGGNQVMLTTLTRVHALLAGMQPAQQRAYVEGLALAQKAVTRSLIYRKARIAFATIVGQTWFPEFPSLDDNKIAIPYAGGDLEVNISMREIPVQI